jgi:hypothetical protein
VTCSNRPTYGKLRVRSGDPPVGGTCTGSCICQVTGGYHVTGSCLGTAEVGHPGARACTYWDQPCLV